MRKKRGSKKKKNCAKVNKFLNFGTQKSVFWAITISAIVLTILGLTLVSEERQIIISLNIIWIMEAIYVWIYLEARKTYNFK